MMRRLIACGLVLGLGLGLSAADHKHDAKPDAKNPLFEKLKSLAGTWVAVDKDGKPTEQVVSVYKVTAGGSAIQETIFPGSDHEMVTVYHLDGKDVVLTHYCMLGNQPKLKVDPTSTEKLLKFAFVGGTNLDAAKDLHMHEGLLRIVSADAIESEWQAYQGGKPAADHKVTMKLVRKKK
jgi:hypothetical protein